MRKKHTLLIWFLAFGTLLFATTFSNYNVSATKTNDIILSGDLKTSGPRSGEDALSAYLLNDGIHVIFHKPIGTVQIEITDSADNTVYAATVDSMDGSTEISLIGLPAGVYTITFSNGSGSMWGDFEW